MEDTISNKCKKCKDCRWLKIRRHNADYSRGGGTCIQPYRSHGCNITGRYFSDIACRFFEESCRRFKEKEENMTQKEFDKTIGAMDKNISDIAKIIDKMDELIESLPDDFKDIKEDEKPVEKKKTTNKYNIGDVVYIPFKIKGMEARVIKTEDTWGNLCKIIDGYRKDPEYKTDIVYKLTRPLIIDNVTRGDLNKKERSDGPYWKCFAMDTITQESLDAIQEDLK